jgi:Uma2 family endonuclease
MATTIAAPLTLEEFAQLPDDGVRHEISEGELITMWGPKSLHSRIIRKVFKAIETALEKSGYGEAFPEAGYVLSSDPLTVRQPDVCVLSTERIQSSAPDDYFEGAPELAVEVVSPSDSAEDLEIKVEQYLQSGAKQVWVLYPKTKRIHVFQPDSQVRVLDETQTLDAAELFPGFSVKVADLFLSENHAKA